MASRITRRAWAAALGLCAATFAVPGARAQEKTEITLARFFGACESDYGSSTDVAQARGECGVITTLVNLFNATNKEIVVKPQIIEWGPYYQQLTARFAARDIPTIAVMHSAQVGDFVRARVVQPIGDELKAAGIDPADFTPNARAGVTLDDKIYAMPWDTHSWLWHLNVNLFKQAGLVDEKGEPILPKTVEEMLAQAKTVREKTGKPYIVIATTASGDEANGARGFYSWLYDQNGTIFPNGYDKADFNTPAARTAFETWSKLVQTGAVTKGLDSGGSVSAFLNGGGAVFMTGTWRVDILLAASEKPDSPLHDGYTARVFPSLFGEQHVWTDNHTWVMPRGGATEKQRKAALVFLKFMWDHNLDWARAGHLPARQSVMNNYAKLPLRQYLVDIPSFGRAAPHDVRRQFGFQNLIGNEVAAMINTGKSVDAAIASAQDRSEQLLRGR